MPKSANQWRERLRKFAADECRSSRLYEVVSSGMADDPELLDWIAAVSHSRGDATLILAAVHERLLAGVDGGGLERFYPNLIASAAPADDAYPAFRAFVWNHRDELAPLLAARGTQTNEVRRCTYLLPAFVFTAARAQRALWIIDVGASAGLNLLFDRYAYDYGGGELAGDPKSPVLLTTQLRGVRPPTAPLPRIAGRVGLDLAPVDVEDAAATRWLEACVWPEHVDRFAMLRAALALARTVKPRVIAGNAIDVLPSLIANADRAAAVVVVNTNVLLYFSAAERATYGRVLYEAAARRELFWVTNEHPRLLRQAGFAGSFVAPSDPAALPLAITHFRDGKCDEFVVAEVGPHGRWLEWFAPRPA